MGFEFINSLDPKSISENIVKEALTKLDAIACPAGKMPVIIDNGFGGVIFHEACGHLLETTSVAKKASVFHDKMGEKIASSKVFFENRSEVVLLKIASGDVFENFSQCRS